MEEESDDEEETKENSTSSKELTSQLLQSICERVNFKQSDDIRLKAAEQLRAALKVPEEKPEEAQQELLLTGGANLALLVDILLAVRGVGQAAAVGLLVHRLDLLAAFPLYRTRPVLSSQTASLDCLFSLISHHLHAHRLAARQGRGHLPQLGRPAGAGHASLVAGAGQCQICF